MRIMEVIAVLLAATGLSYHLTRFLLGRRVSRPIFIWLRLILALGFVGAALNHQYPWIYGFFLGLLIGNLLAGEPRS